MTISRGFKITLVVLGLLLISVASGLLHVQNRQLRRRLEQQQATAQQATLLRVDNIRMQTLVTDQGRDAHTASTTVHRQIEEARGEIAALEKAAAAQRMEMTSKAARDAGALASNRDPTTGLTRLEYFRDIGHATPVAAFQTVVHAALKGDEAALGKYLILPPAARTRAEALLERLPPEGRAQWTPEKLAVLSLTGALTELPALQIMSETFESPDSAVLTFRAPQFRRDEKLNLKLTPDGWNVVVGTGLIGALEKKLVGRPPPNP